MIWFHPYMALLLTGKQTILHLVIGKLILLNAVPHMVVIIGGLSIFVPSVKVKKFWQKAPDGAFILHYSIVHNLIVS